MESNGSNKLFNYDDFINLRTMNRIPEPRRSIVGVVHVRSENTNHFIGAFSNIEACPIKEMTIKLVDDSYIHFEGADILQAFQPLPAHGLLSLTNLLKDFTNYLHKPPNFQNMELIVTNSSHNALQMAFDMFVDEGCPILVQAPFYPGVESIVRQYRSILLPIIIDDEGLSAKNLLETLKNWALQCETDNSLKMPKVIYTNPTASNPTGNTMSLKRKKEIYKICCEYNLIILEDDVLNLMHYGDAKPSSFLSMDRERRVIRIDGLSKCFDSGSRLSWTIGPQPLIDYMALQIINNHFHLDPLPQMIYDKLFKTWGFKKMLLHIDKIRILNRDKCSFLTSTFKKHLHGLCEWSVPDGGIFIWVKVLHVKDVSDMLINKELKRGLLFFPGHVMIVDSKADCSFFRITFNRASFQEIEETVIVLAKLIKEEMSTCQISKRRNVMIEK